MSKIETITTTYTHKKPEFNPSEVWQLDEQLDEPILRAREAMNLKGSKALITNLQEQVRTAENGVKYAVLKGDNPEEYSMSEALVMFNPFANAATPNMLVRAEFIREVGRFANVHDQHGKLKPVVMLASPGIGGSTLNLSRSERRQIRRGDLGPASSELLHAVSSLDIGRVSLLGYSQGADLALAGARKSSSANLDTHTVAIGDPAGAEKRALPKLALDFFNAPSLKFSIERTGLDAQKESVGKGRYEFPRFIGSILSSPKDNLDLILGMDKGSLESQMMEVLQEGQVGKLAVAYGSESNIAKPGTIEPILQRLTKHDTSDVITSIKIAGANHTWGDQITLLAKLYSKAFI